MTETALRAMGGEIEPRYVPTIDGLQLIYRGIKTPPTPILLSRSQARALIDVLRTFVGPDD